MPKETTNDHHQSDPLPNPQHEAFAREVASGRNATQAYLNVYGTGNHPSGPDRRAATTGGHRLLRRKSIAARVKAIQQAGAASVALDLREIHEFLTRVVRTPAGQVTPASDLCTRVKQTRDGATDVWMPDKLACIRLSAKLQGFLDTARLAPRNRGTRLAQTGTPIPSDPSEQEEADHDPTIVTEEYRAILIAEKRAAALEEIRQAEEDPLAEEQRAAEERRILEEKYFRQIPPPPPPVQSVPPIERNPPVRLPAIAGPVPPGPAAWVGPSGRQPYFGQGFRSQPKPDPAPGAGHQLPSFSRVTPDSSSKIVNNHHHPAEPESPETRQQEPNQQARDRMSREAAVRTRLTGDGCTSDALLVL